MSGNKEVFVKGIGLVEQKEEETQIKILDEEEASKAKQQLDHEMTIDPMEDLEEYIPGRINWSDNFKSWDDCKDEAVKLMEINNHEHAIFIAHARNEIIGKPQLIHTSIKKVTLMKKVFKYKTAADGTQEKHIQTKFLDDSFDKRYDGNIDVEWSLDFWVYRVISEKKEYYVLSEKELPMQNCSIKGMLVEMRDFTEISRSMKIKSLSRVFFLRSFDPIVKILSPPDLIKFTKGREISEDVWNNYLGYHELGTTNVFPHNVNLLRSAQLLSSKVDGYPLHLWVMGPAGTRKSMGYIESIAYKFSEESEIVEGSNSRIKGLSPSFKEKPANIGYLARCERMGWVDEIGKMVEFECNKHQSVVTNVLGELNFLLDQKKRTVGSGNDNDCIVKVNSKFLFVSNPIKGKDNIYRHVGIIDPTTMSRMLWWVQSHEEQEFVLGTQGIKRGIPPIQTQAQDYFDDNDDLRVNTPTILSYTGVSKACVSVGGNPFDTISRDEFLTIFDTCNSFLINHDVQKVENITNLITQMAKDPMKGVWRPRGSHHVKLLLDGIVKYRCLFIDYDETYTVKQEDYDTVEKLLLQMVKNWDTDLSLKPFQDFKDGGL